MYRTAIHPFLLGHFATVYIISPCWISLARASLSDCMDRPEQDQEGGDDLPTYDDLAEKNGPNSR